ncbi:helix-turn-helix transcriptional regulator [Lichenifustis flavocetrariae]|uniref:LuxR family transcriptional regulator n=1 Tax=Lichenifustis flavocetrariae TaxID=2949735 RepID=A0AA42CMV1_9HYPH|nr:LuxR family transcriptional regulator [Lichenifustis flavocetrariae]MCW6508750.1 LuxR family transcriptional regulator [Lichenifustis flavocetrariae]
MISELFHRLDACEQRTEAQGVVEALSLALGFRFFSYAVPEPGLNVVEAAGMLLTNYPQAWQDRYQARKYQVEDAVLVHGHREIRPFAWGGDDYLKTISPSERRIFFEAQAFGIVSGFAVPVHGPDQTCAVFSVAGPEPRPCVTDVGHSDFHALLAAAQAVHGKFVQWRQRPAPNDIRLSEHERLCLLWTTQGKTAWEVAQIIGRSKATVDFHLRRAAGKLGAVNKVHAAFKARELDLL